MLSLPFSLRSRKPADCGQLSVLDSLVTAACCCHLAPQHTPRQQLGTLSECGHRRLRHSRSRHLTALQIEACLDATPVEVGAVATNLRVCCLGVKKEMVEARGPLPSRTRLDQLPPFTRHSVRHLDRLAAVLDLSARPLLTPYSKESPVVSPVRRVADPLPSHHPAEAATAAA